MLDLIADIDNEWRDFLAKELSHEYARQLAKSLEPDVLTNSVCPDSVDWFRAFKDTAPEDVRVVILGQDPFFNGEAMGLSFSVKPGYKLTPSTRNILKEVTKHSDVSSFTGNLEGWATQGVFMLNTCLTTRKGKAGAHSKLGWENLTRAALNHLNDMGRPIVYLAWGLWAHKGAEHVTNPLHTVIKTSHPSPLGAYKQGKTFEAFLKSDCFEAANQYLVNHGARPIDWMDGLQKKNEGLL